MAPKVSSLKFFISYFSLLSLAVLLLMIYKFCLNQHQETDQPEVPAAVEWPEPLGILANPFMEKPMNSVIVNSEEDDHREEHDNSTHLLTRPITVEWQEPFEFIANQFMGKPINLALVNVEESERQGEVEGEGPSSIRWSDLGMARTVWFDRVPSEVRWEKFFPGWIDEEEKREVPRCPAIPMPAYEDYGEVDVVFARVPCGEGGEQGRTKGIRDVLRLQVHLVVANLVVRNGRRGGGPVVVFVGSCGPMWEIFRCEDLLKRYGDLWIYKPDLRRLEHKISLPSGSCQLASRIIKRDNGDIEYDVSKTEHHHDHPKEAYVTVLHSSEAYVCGAIALAQSILRTNSTKDLILLADQSISDKSLKALKIAGWKIRYIKRIKGPNAKKNCCNEWNYSKLRIWQLIDYDKIMFIDSDLIILKNLDRFFSLPALTAAGNDQVLFNSGVMIVEPSECVFRELMEKRHQMVSYNGGDQGYLNEMFTWWHRLPRRLNRLKVFARSQTRNTSEIQNAFTIHYMGYKPWMCYRDYDCNWNEKGHHVFASDAAHKRWWDIYNSMPKRLQPLCALSTSLESRLKKERTRARNAHYPDGHWRIKIKDPRQHHLQRL